MFKLAAVTAVAAAGSADFQETAELFQIKLHQQEVMKLEAKAKALERESMKYEHQMQASHHGKQFEGEVKALVHTKEFVALAKFVEALKKKGPTQQMKEVKMAYMAQLKKVEAAHMKMKMTSHKTSKMIGQDPNHTLIVNIDNDEWYAFNVEYYKLREMEYYIQYKVPEVAALRGKVRALVNSGEFGAIEKHWLEVTQQEQHQVVVKHQGALVEAAVKTLHMTKEDEKWMDPAHSPVMFDAWHIVYCYFMAVGKGDLEPMLDFMIDGKHADEFVQHVKPKFPAPKNYPEDLYLF